MKIAFSPCPNDTFIFHAWVHDLIPGAPKLDVRYADIDITNGLAANPDGPDTPEVMKISYAALPYVLSDYALLPAGGALGRGCGPLVLTANGTTDPAYLSGRRVAVPSERSTAYLLFRLWAAQNVPGGVGEIVVMPFDQIMPAVRDGKIDAGLVIHEARFTYQNYDLKLMTDLSGTGGKATQAFRSRLEQSSHVATWMLTPSPDGHARRLNMHGRTRMSREHTLWNMPKKWTLT